MDRRSILACPFQRISGITAPQLFGRVAVGEDQCVAIASNETSVTGTAAGTARAVVGVAEVVLRDVRDAVTPA